VLKAEIFLAIDPGTKKCGYAIVDSDMKLLAKKVIPFEKLTTDLKEIFYIYDINKVI